MTTKEKGEKGEVDINRGGEERGHVRRASSMSGGEQTGPGYGRRVKVSTTSLLLPYCNWEPGGHWKCSRGGRRNWADECFASDSSIPVVR